MVVAVVLRVIVLVVIFANTVGEIQCESNDFMSVIASLSPCLNYVNGQSDTPTVPCCTQLAVAVAVAVKLNPECLCEVLNGGGASVGINITTTRALELPAACNVTIPPVSQCNGGGPSSASNAIVIAFAIALRIILYLIILFLICGTASYIVEPDNFRRRYNQERAEYALRQY